MANNTSKGNKKATLNLTKNGRPKYKSFSLDKLVSALETTNRPRDKDKIQRIINNRNAG